MLGIQPLNLFCSLPASLKHLNPFLFFCNVTSSVVFRKPSAKMLKMRICSSRWNHLMDFWVSTVMHECCACIKEMWKEPFTPAHVMSLSFFSSRAPWIILKPFSSAIFTCTRTHNMMKAERRCKIGSFIHNDRGRLL